jgi:glycosyltransferase involved in cell wall biosynthesis
MSMKICYVLPWFPSVSPTTPESRQAIFEYRHVKRLSAAGYRFKIVSILWKGQSAYERVDDNVEVYRVPYLFLLKSIRYPLPDFLKLSGTLKRLCREWDPDIMVYGHMIYLTTLPSLFLRRRIDKPVVVTTDVFPGINWFFGDRLVDTFGYWYTLLLGRWFLRTSDGIQLLVSGMNDYIRDLGADVGKTFLVNRGVDVDTFKPDYPKNGLRKEFGVSRDDILVLFVGRLDLVKGVPYLIDAVKRIMREHDNVKLLVVGEGSLYADYSNMTKDYRDRIIFAGYRSDVPEIMKTSDIFVLPSLSEGAANVVMEASASGLAVVATDVGEIPSIVRDGATGLLVKPRDSDGLYVALKRLVEDPELVRQMGVAGRKHMEEHYCWDIVCRQVDENYRSVIKRYAKRGHEKNPELAVAATAPESERADAR